MNRSFKSTWSFAFITDLNFGWQLFPLEVLERIKCHVRGKDKELTYDGHEGVEVADVEALARHVDEELDDSSSVLLLHGLLTK